MKNNGAISNYDDVFETAVSDKVIFIGVNLYLSLNY